MKINLKRQHEHLHHLNRTKRTRCQLHENQVIQVFVVASPSASRSIVLSMSLWQSGRRSFPFLLIWFIRGSIKSCSARLRLRVEMSDAALDALPRRIRKSSNALESLKQNEKANEVKSWTFNVLKALYQLQLGQLCNARSNCSQRNLHAGVFTETSLWCSRLERKIRFADESPVVIGPAKLSLARKHKNCEKSVCDWMKSASENKNIKAHWELA